MKRILLFSFPLPFPRCFAAGRRSREEKALGSLHREYRPSAERFGIPQSGRQPVSCSEGFLRLVVYINSECERCAAQTSEWAKREREFLQAATWRSSTMSARRIFRRCRHCWSEPGCPPPCSSTRKAICCTKQHLRASLPLHTFLLDGQGRVVLYGDPLTTPFYRRYREAIRRLSPHRK